MANTITGETLEWALGHEQHLGWGYATRDNIESASKRERLDRSVVAVANEVPGMDAEAFFHWTNSKWGRWLIDGVHGCDQPPTRATVRKYLNATAVAEALDGAVVLS